MAGEAVTADGPWWMTFEDGTGALSHRKPSQSLALVCELGERTVLGLLSDWQQWASPETLAMLDEEQARFDRLREQGAR